MMNILDLPSLPLQECTFRLDDATASAFWAGGSRVMVSQIGDPAWRLSIQTAPLERAERQVWDTWKAQQRGGLNLFRAFDLSHSAPLQYQGARSPVHIRQGWDGTAMVKSLVAGGLVELAGVPAGYVARNGDRFGFELGQTYRYFHIEGDAVATATGNLALRVLPVFDADRIPAILPSKARLWRPCATFAINWQTWRHQAVASPQPASFEARQVLI